MYKIITTVLLLSLSQLTNAQKKSPDADARLKGLDTELQNLLTTWKTAGFAVAVVDKNKVIYSKGFGYRDVEKKLPVTPKTLFAIGSCSKAFTSSLLGILRDQGKVDFDESPRKYVPSLSFNNAEMNESIIVRDLMSHRTGLPRHDYSWYMFPTFNRDSLISRIAFMKPFTGVRKQWYYNNFMFLLQGSITEHLTGSTWEENVREKLFTPLHMTQSNLSITEMEKATEASLGYEVVKDQIKKTKYYHIAAMAPAGSINSNVEEMSNWVKTWIYGGKFEGKQILPAGYVSEAMTSQSVVGAGLPEKEHPDVHLANYGYGWFLASYKGHYRVEHGGNIDGFSASTSFFPSDSLGIVVLVNQDGSAVPGIVRNIIADRMLKTSRSDWSKEYKELRAKYEKTQKEANQEKSSNTVKGTKPSHPLADYAGRFECEGYGPFNVVLKNDSLFANFKLMTVWLRHKHYDVFEPFRVTENRVDTTNGIGVAFNFRSNDVGEISSIHIKMEQTIDPLEFQRGSLPVALDKKALARYEGEFELSGMVARFFLKGETLALTVPGQPEYELIPAGSNKFSIKNLDGYKMEFMENGGVFTEVLFMQPNGNFKAKRKK